MSRQIVDTLYYYFLDVLGVIRFIEWNVVNLDSWPPVWPCCWWWPVIQRPSLATWTWSTN